MILKACHDDDDVCVCVKIICGQWMFRLWPIDELGQFCVQVLMTFMCISPNSTRNVCYLGPNCSKPVDTRWWGPLLLIYLFLVSFSMRSTEALLGFIPCISWLFIYWLYWPFIYNKLVAKMLFYILLEWFSETYKVNVFSDYIY